MILEFGQIWQRFDKAILISAIIIVTFIIAKTIKRTYERYLKKYSEKTKIVPAKYAIIKHFLTGFIYIIGISVAIYVIPPLRAISVSIFASAGLFAVVIGFAAQQAFSNIVSGLFIVIFRPFRVGDAVRIKPDIVGNVEDITLRHTVIRSPENKRYVIPNAVISNEIIENSNLWDESICKFVDFGISYDSDIDKAMGIMSDEALKHPLFVDKRNEDEKKNNIPPVPVKVLGFSESCVNLRAWVWSSNPANAFNMGCDLNKSIKSRFDKEGIEIPYPYRTIILKESKIKRGLKKSRKKNARR